MGGEEFGALTGTFAPVLHDVFGDDDPRVHVGYAGDTWVDVICLVGHGIDNFVELHTLVSGHPVEVDIVVIALL